MSSGISKEKEKRNEKKRKKERKKGRKKERKKRLILLKKYISRAKLVKLKVPVIIQDPDSSHIEAIV